MNCKRLFDEIDSISEEYVKFWIDVCNIESPTDCKEGVDAVGAAFIKRAEALGWDVEISKQRVSGDAVAITMNKNVTLPPIVLSGHLDTVHPVGLFGYPPVKRDGNILNGPGVTDCKGGAVAALLAMAALKSCGFTERKIILILQSDEEISSKTSDGTTVDFMAEKATGCAAFLNAEPFNSGFLTLERKGILRYSFEIGGVATHSSRSFEGSSAIAEAAHKILELEKWKDKDGITANCGVISGGSASNTVPAACEFTVDFRFKNKEQRELIESEVKRISDTSFIGKTSCKATLVSERVPMEYSGRNYALLDRINRIFENTGIPTVAPFMSLGGSDAADMTVRGVPVIDSIGVRGGNIHSINEFAYVESLAESAKMQAAIISCFDEYEL